MDICPKCFQHSLQYDAKSQKAICSKNKCHFYLPMSHKEYHIQIELAPYNQHAYNSRTPEVVRIVEIKKLKEVAENLNILKKTNKAKLSEEARDRMNQAIIVWPLKEEGE